MKKIIALILAISIIAIGLAGCSSKPAEQTTGTPAEQTPEVVTIKIGASPTPHAEILKSVQSVLEAQNIKLEIIEFTDYVQPNTTLADKELDANFFQHQPYLDSFNQERGQSLVSAGLVHVEPLGLYSKSLKALEELKEGASIAIPNDPSNASRALLLLEINNLITLKEGAGINATEKDILSNPKNIKFELVEAAQLPRVLEDVDAAVINTNYALPAGLNPTKDALALEGKDSPYANIIAVRKGDESRAEIKKLIEALNSDAVKKFIEDKYQGAITPAF